MKYHLALHELLESLRSELRSHLPPPLRRRVRVLAQVPSLSLNRHHVRTSLELWIMYHNNYAIACLSHDKSKTCNLIGLREFKTADSAHTRNRAIVTRPFSLAEGWGLGTRLGRDVRAFASDVTPPSPNQN